MKYLVFFTVLILGVPIGYIFSKKNEKIEYFILFIVLFFTCRVDSATINFFSHETYRGTTRGFEIAVVDIAVLILFLLVVYRGNIYQIKILPPGSILLFIYFLISFISIRNSGVTIYSYFELLKMLRMYFFYWILYNYIQDLKHIDIIIKFIGIIIIYIFLVVIQQKYLQGIYQVNGPFPHQNSLVMYMIVFSSIIFAALLNIRGTTFKTIYLFTVFGMSGICIISTLSRAGLACFALSLLLIFLLSYCSGFSLKKISFTFLFIILAGAVLYKAMDTIIERFEKAPEESATTRVDLAHGAVRMANDKFFGIGINNFGLKINAPYKYGDHIKRGAWNEKEGIVETVYLLIAAETGWLNLIIFLIFIFKFYFINIFNYFRYRQTEYNFIPIALVGALSAIYFESALEWVLKQTGNYYQLMLIFALIAAMSRIYKNAASTD